MTSPFLRIYYMMIYYTICWGCMWWHTAVKVCRQSGSTVPRSLGSGILVPCRHHWIFMAAQVWHGMSQMLVPGHSSGQLAWQEQLEPVLSVLLVVHVQQMWAACMVQVWVMQSVLLRSGASMWGSMWNHCWCILDSCSVGGHISQ